jgi:hypothetical protein
VRSLTGSTLFVWVASVGLALGACGKTTSCTTDPATDDCSESSGGSPSTGGAPSAGGSTGSGGTPGTGGSGEGGVGICYAYQDAIPNGDDCVAIIGYAWHPPGCLPIQCGCAGADCDELYPTYDACVAAHEDCPQ